MALVKSAKRLSACKAELESAERLFAANDLARAFHHLERAHVLGQPWLGPHMRAHYLMLKVGLRRGDTREVWGQIIRLTGGGLLSLLGRLPEGNTGGANVPAETPMVLPPDLQALCDER